MICASWRYVAFSHHSTMSVIWSRVMRVLLVMILLLPHLHILDAKDPNSIQTQLHTFAYRLRQNEIIYYFAANGNSVLEKEIRESRLLSENQVALVTPGGNVRSPNKLGQNDNESPCILDPVSGRNVSTSFRNGSTSTYARRSATLPAYEPMLVVTSGNLNLTSMIVSECLESFSRSAVVWIFKINPEEANDIDLHRKMSPLSNKLKLQDNIYLVDSYSSSPSHEIYGLKGQVIVRPLSLLWRSNLSSKSALNPVLSGALVRRRNFNSTVITAAHVQQPGGIRTHTGEESLRVPDWAAPEELTYDFFAYMQDLLHFDAQFYNTSTWLFSRDETEVSLADLVNNGTADVGLTAVGIYSQANFSWLFVTRTIKLVYIYYHATEQTTTGNLFHEIFSLDALICVLAVIITTFLLSKLFFPESSFEELFTWCGSVFSQQGIEPESQPLTKYEIASRAYYLAIGFGSMLFYTILSAFLLAKFSTTIGISGLNDLVSRRFTFGTGAEGLIDNGFKYGYYSPASPMWPIRKMYRTYNEEATGIVDVVNKPRFAFITLLNAFINHSPELEAIYSNPNCPQLRQMIIPGDRRWGSSFVKKNSELSDHFNYARLLMTQTGVMSRTLRKMLRREEETQPTCKVSQRTDGSSDSIRGLYLQEILFVFYFLAFGIVTSVTVLVIEFWRSRAKEAKRKGWKHSESGVWIH